MSPQPKSYSNFDHKTQSAVNFHKSLKQNKIRKQPKINAYSTSKEFYPGSQMNDMANVRLLPEYFR